MLINFRKEKSVQERKWNQALHSPAVNNIYDIKIEGKKANLFSNRKFWFSSRGRNRKREVCLVRRRKGAYVRASSSSSVLGTQ